MRVEPAEPRRAHRGGVLAHVQVVASAEQAEQVLGVVGGDRQQLLARELPVEDRGHGVGRVLLDRRRVAVPGGVRGEPREVRVAASVDTLVRPHQGVHGQLVEHDHHDRRVSGAAGGPGLAALAQHQRRHVGQEQEGGREHERRRRQDGEHRAVAVARAYSAAPAAPAARPTAMLGTQASRGRSCRTIAAVRTPRRRAGAPSERAADKAGEPFEANQQERRQQREPEREQDDLARLASLGPRRTPGGPREARRAARLLRSPQRRDLRRPPDKLPAGHVLVTARLPMHCHCHVLGVATSATGPSVRGRRPRAARRRGTISAVEDWGTVLVALFVSVAGLNTIARWLSVPNPIPLVLGGLVLGLLPGIPKIELDPDLVLVSPDVGRRCRPDRDGGGARSSCRAVRHDSGPAAPGASGRSRHDRRKSAEEERARALCLGHGTGR